MNVPAEKLLPHRPPMRFIETLTHSDATGARATTRFSLDHFAVSDGLVVEAALVECLAQTVAAALGQRANGGEAKPGMLVAVTNFQIHTRPAAGANLEIEARERKCLGPMRLIAGTITADGQLIASGALTLYA